MNSFLTKTTLLLASSLTVMAGAMIAPALPQIADAFEGIPNHELLTKLILTMPALFIAISSPAAGWLIDRFSKIRLFLFCMLLYAVAGTAGWYLDDIYHILISRALLGLAVAVIMTTATTLIGDYFAGEERMQFLGIQSAFMALGGTVFVAMSGILADIGWRFPFLVYAMSLIVVVLAALFLKEPDRNKQQKAEDEPENEIKPNFRVYSIVYLLTFFGMVLFYVVPVQTPFLMREMGVSQGKIISLALVILTLFAALASGNFRRIKTRLSFHQIYLILFSLVGFGYLLAGLAGNLTVLFLAMIVAGLGSGLMMPNANLCLISSSGPSFRGKVIGGLVTAVFLGQFFSPILLRPVVSATSLSMTHMFAGGGSLLIALILGVAGPGIWERGSSKSEVGQLRSE